MQMGQNNCKITTLKHMFNVKGVLFLSLAITLLSLKCNQNSVDNQSRVLPAENGFTNQNHFQVSPGDSCPVCGMTVSNYPKFAGAIQLRDGRTYYTCGTGCLVRCWLDPEGFLGVKKPGIHHLFVQEFFSGRISNVDDILFVPGSDFIGPMGRDVAPVEPSQVAAFISRHGGDKAFNLSELTVSHWQDIQSAKRNSL